MVDKKGGGPSKSKLKTVTTQQKTLFDLFPRKNQPTSLESDVGAKNSNAAANVCSPTPEEIVPTSVIAEKVSSASLEPRPFYPLFAKPAIPTDSATELTVGSDEGIIETQDEHEKESFSISTEFPTQKGGSQQDPIILDASPTLCNARILAPLIPSRPSELSTPSTTKSPNIRHVEAPYPGDSSQHVRGPQTIFSSSDLPYSRRFKYYLHPTEIQSNIILPLNLEYPTTFRQAPSHRVLPSNAITDRDGHLKDIPDHDQRHPAISRLYTERAISSHKLWTDKWHPTCAEQVLGNESNALYLRDWLCALELHLETEASGSNKSMGVDGKGKSQAKMDARVRKRPRVVRAIEKHQRGKKRRIDREDDWIVYSDESEEETFPVDDIGETSKAGRPLSRLCRKDSDEYPPSCLNPSPGYRDSFDTLTNTILLAGPPGVGKTAAVYACAEELGWQVFEVYPGIGKRNGPGIENLVGDVGKNHHVHKTNASLLPKGRNALMMLLGKNTEVEQELRNSGGHNSTSGESGSVPPLTNHPEGVSTEVNHTIRQSVILLEEVDILFKEDASFWPAVTNFIKDCKRPVICTCNDISLVPISDLPLQAILNFQPCPSPVAASYLQSLCFAEGYIVERDHVLQLYESRSKPSFIDIPDSPTSPRSRDFPVPDFRRAIHCVQFQCLSTDFKLEHVPRWEPDQDFAIEDLCEWSWSSGKAGVSQEESTTKDNLFATTGMRTKTQSTLAMNHADLISFVDSYLMRDLWDTPEALALSGFQASADDEIGHRILFSPRSKESSFGYYDRDEEMASTVVRLSCGALDAGLMGEPTSNNINSFRTRGLFRARVGYQEQIAKALGNIVPLTILTMRRSIVHADYVTYIRDIVAAEDIEEGIHLRKQRTGRTTRNSGGGGYVRNLILTPEERIALGWERLLNL